MTRDAKPSRVSAPLAVNQDKVRLGPQPGKRREQHEALAERKQTGDTAKTDLAPRHPALLYLRGPESDKH
jgi:hypothetical protein